MSRSTASFIAYDVRPAKQIERRGIVELLNCAKHAGFNISTYRYVGFGGTKFIDFQLMDSYVGFQKYQSIEHDDEIFNRCKFNKPFTSIEMFSGPLSEFLVQDNAPGNSVYWLDFEIGVSADLFADINSIAAKVRNGGIILTTIRAELPRGKGEHKHLLKSKVPSLGATIERFTPEHLTVKNFPDAAGLLLLEMLRSAFSPRLQEGLFHPIFRVIYNDSTWMCTVGGVFDATRSRRVGKLKRSVSTSLKSMCPRQRHRFYRVPEFNFTQLERLLLEKSVVSEGLGYTRRLTSLGLKKQDLESYSEIARFVPKYVEAAF